MFIFYQLINSRTIHQLTYSIQLKLYFTYITFVDIKTVLKNSLLLENLIQTEVMTKNLGNY